MSKVRVLYNTTHETDYSGSEGLSSKNNPLFNLDQAFPQSWIVLKLKEPPLNVN